MEADSKAIEARTLLEEARRIQPFQASPAAYEKFADAAGIYRSVGLHFEAGIAMSSAVDSAFGDPDRMRQAHQSALEDWQRVLDQPPEESLVALAASHKIGRDLFLWSATLLDMSRADVNARLASLDLARADCLVRHYDAHPDWEAYLIRGIQLAADLLGGWTVSCPAFEVPTEVEGPGTPYVVNLASAFKLYARHHQWERVDRLARRQPGALTSASLRGWAAVAAAEVNPDQAAKYFDEAATLFASDTAPKTAEETVARGGSWSAVLAGLHIRRKLAVGSASHSRCPRDPITPVRPRCGGK